jgi:hypothetical protein
MIRMGRQGTSVIGLGGKPGDCLRVVRSVYCKFD